MWNNQQESGDLVLLQIFRRDPGRYIHLSEFQASGVTGVEEPPHCLAFHLG